MTTFQCYSDLIGALPARQQLTVARAALSRLPASERALVEQAVSDVLEGLRLRRPGVFVGPVTALELLAALGRYCNGRRVR